MTGRFVKPEGAPRWVVVGEDIKEGAYVVLGVFKTKDEAEDIRTRLPWSRKYRWDRWTDFRTIGPANENDPAARVGYRVLKGEPR